MNLWRQLAGSAAIVILAAGSAGAQNVVAINDNPWGQGATISSAMNDVFGAGQWSLFGFAAADPTSIFSAATRFVYIDGSDGTDATFRSYVDANRAAMESWVTGGGRLFINSAPWDYTPYNFLFGTTTTAQNDPCSSGTASDPTNPLFADRGYGNPGTSWTGNYFAHGFVVGGGTALIGGCGGTSLAEMTAGSGLVVSGELTTDNWRGPSPEAQVLTRNILDYTAGAAVTTTPEPASIVLFGTGLLGLVAVSRRGRKDTV